MITIGVVCRIDKTENNVVYVFNKKLCDYLILENVRIIPLINYDISLLKLCDGFILPGGDYETIDFLIIKYAYEFDLSLLGICMGMQSLGKYFNGNLELVDNHYSKSDYHFVNIDSSSKIFKILNRSKIKVNSRHKYKLSNTDLKISAYSQDNVIEAIEIKNKRFVLGVQWHPEKDFKNNIDSKNIFLSFINSARAYKNTAL